MVFNPEASASSHSAAIIPGGDIALFLPEPTQTALFSPSKREKAFKGPFRCKHGQSPGPVTSRGMGDRFSVHGFVYEKSVTTPAQW